MSTTAQFNQANAQHITIRFSEPADVPAVLNFYQSNQHANVDHRGDDIFTDRTEKGRTLLIFKPDGDLGMSSMSHPFFDHNSTNPHGDRVEIGSTRARLDGFNLYPFIVASQIIHEFLDRAPTDVFFACIHKGNPITDVLHKKVGWNMHTPTQAFADAVGEGANITKLNWLTADSDTFAHQARIVLDFINRGHVTHKVSGEVLNLDLKQFSLATTFRSYVDELANGKFGEMLQKSHPLPLKKAREAFERYLGGVTNFPELSPKP